MRESRIANATGARPYTTPEEKAAVHAHRKEQDRQSAALRAERLADPIKYQADLERERQQMIEDLKKQ